MTQARRELVSLDATPYYHCVSRCVRRAYLCGRDEHTGRNFEHRRGWIVQRIKQLANVFAIDVAAYAVMTNHFHVVVRIDAERAASWNGDEVIRRWRLLFAGPTLVRRHAAGETLLPAEQRRVDEYVDEFRARLADLSWYMRCLNEAIARWANAEDGCTGRFWEGRFKSQALLDEVAVLACMTYVDLNPVRAGMAKTPESSDYTAIQERLGLQPGMGDEPPTAPNVSGDIEPAPLLPLVEGTGSKTPSRAIAYSLNDYLALLDWTGRAMVPGKRGSIPEDLPPILVRLGVAPKEWLKAAGAIETRFSLAIGSAERLEELAGHLKQQWLRGIGACRALYRPVSAMD